MSRFEAQVKHLWVEFGTCSEWMADITVTEILLSGKLVLFRSHLVTGIQLMHFRNPRNALQSMFYSWRQELAAHHGSKSTQMDEADDWIQNRTVHSKCPTQLIQTLWNENGRNHCNYLEEKWHDIFEAFKFQKSTKCNPWVHRGTVWNFGCYRPLWSPRRRRKVIMGNL